MSAAALHSPALTIALALAAGMTAQVVARHLRIPGIVLLLAAGVLLGPDGLGVVRPGTLGRSLHDLVGFAVAVILFDGGMNLNLGRLRREARSIRQIVTLGAVVTAAGGALAARWILGWDWTLAVLFGTLVIVTGPTVITPLLRRIKVKERVATVLEAEGVLGDAVGALIAVVTLEVVLSPAGPSLAAGAWDLASRLGFGALLGTAAGLLLALLLRYQRLIPEGLESVFTLAAVVALFQGSNALMPESGILSVIMAGLVVGNARAHVVSELLEFKEQLTVLLVGLLFVLLAADTRLSEVYALGWPGLLTVAVLMFLVRPVNVLVGTLGSDLTLRERAFVAWLAPRGIVAAAVSSLFAQTLEAEGIAGGGGLRALVFLVIAVTVVVQGLSGGAVARLLDLRRPADNGFVVLGAHSLSLALGRVLRAAGEEVVFIDSNPDAVHEAEEAGFRALHGSGLDEPVQERAALDTRAGCLGATSNEEVNLLFARRARKDFKIKRVWVAVRQGHLGVDEEVVQRLGGHVLFGAPQKLTTWIQRLEEGGATVEAWRLDAPPPAGRQSIPDAGDGLLPLAYERGRRVLPVDESVTFRKGDILHAVLSGPERLEAAGWLESHGWVPLQPAAAPIP